MQHLVIYYSWSGHTAALARQLAEEQGAALCEVRDSKKPGKIRAFTAGCLAAMRGKSWPVKPLEEDMAAYERITVMGPVWAGGPAPAVNSVLQALPGGKQVDVVLVSASGSSSGWSRIAETVKAKGCTLETRQDIKG